MMLAETPADAISCQPTQEPVLVTAPVSASSASEAAVQAQASTAPVAPAALPAAVAPVAQAPAVPPTASTAAPMADFTASDTQVPLAPEQAASAPNPAPIPGVCTQPVAVAADENAEASNGLASDAPAAAEDSELSAAPSAGGGLLQGLRGRVCEITGKVSDLETVQKGVQFVTDKSRQVAEHERVQQSVQYVRQKTSELAESERVQKGIEFARDKAKAVSERAQDTAKAVSERTTQGIEFAKETTKAVRAGAGNVWAQGRGSIQRVRAKVGTMQWRGSARETLNMAALEEQWRSIKVQGAEELSVPARTEHTCCFLVQKGSTLRWTFRVKALDIGFGVRMRVQQMGGSREEEVLAMERYDNEDTVSGSWVADEDRTMVLSFDNRYSKLRAKTVAYIVGTEKPSTFQPPLQTSTEAVAADASAAPAPAEAAPQPPPAVASEAPRAIV